MMKTASAVLLIFFFFYSCTKDKTLSQPNAGVDRAPEIVSASLTPESPVSNLPLSVEYDGHGKDNEPVVYNFRWYVNNTIVQEGTIPVLDPGPYKKGDEIFAEIIPSTKLAVGKPFRTAVKNVANLPPTVTSIEMKPLHPVVGDTIVATPSGTDPDKDVVDYLYQWTVNDKPVTDVLPDNNTFSTAGLKKKDVIVVVVTPTDRESKGEKMLSQDVVLRNASPRILSTPPTTLENGVYVYQVSANDPDGDALTYYLIESPTGMTIDSKTGLIRWEPPKKTPGAVELPVKILVDDGDGGKVTQEYSLILNMQ